ncbi:MAG: phage tail tip lysozyme [Snowella sp.]|nr:phage tail tip lysozyme [Snowella sp.]
MAHKHILLKLNDGINDKTSAVIKEVEILQTMLKDWGELTANDIDGQFGNKTDKAVKDFQGKKSLTPDGIVGRNTWAALLKVNPSEVEIIPRPSAGGSGGTGNGKSPFSENKGLIDNELIRHGFSLVQRAAILGSIRQEAGSKFSPYSEEHPGHAGGIGLFQWTDSARRNKVPKFTHDVATDIRNQVEFFVHELETTEKKAGHELRNAKDLKAAMNAMKDYERFGVAGPRDQYAQEILNELQGHH